MARRTPLPTPQPPAEAPPAADAESAPPLAWGAAWSAWPWFDLWLQAWGAWLAPWGGLRTVSGRSGDGDDRRQPDFPWVPQFEAKVIPLRRSDDLPGSEAAKVSMRLRVPGFPWTGQASNVIAIDTIVPRPPLAADDPAHGR